jgi:hypothetical protein
MVKLLGFIQIFITIALVHLMIKSHSAPTEGHFIQVMGIIVMICGPLVCVLWRFLAELATEGMLILADIADGLSSTREGLRNRKYGKRLSLQG